MYLHGATNQAICYQVKLESGRQINVHGFVDSNWARDVDGRRSTSEYVFNIFGGEVIWMRRRQSVVALLTTEAQYITTTHACK